MKTPGHIIGILGVLVFAAAAPAVAELPTPGWKGGSDDFSPDPLYAGNRVLLTRKGGQPVPCARTDDDWAELVRLQRANDTAGDRLSKLESSGAVYEVPPGTEAVVLEPSHLVPGLRLSSGDNAGTVCFTDRNFVTRFRRNRLWD